MRGSVRQAGCVPAKTWIVALGSCIVALGCGAPTDVDVRPVGTPEAAAQTRPSGLPLPPVAREAWPPQPGTAAEAVTAADALAAGRQLMRGERYQEAARYLGIAVELEPSNADGLRLLGNAQARLNNMPEALSTLQRAADVAPDSAGVHFELAMVALISDKLDVAQGAVGRTLELDPQSQRAQELLGTVLHRGGDYEAVLALLEPVIAQQPQRDQSRFIVGLSYLGLERFDEARSALEEVIRRQPGHVDAHLYLAEVLTKLGDEAGATTERATFRRLSAGR